MPRTHTHTHTHIYLCVCMCVYMCVCVVCVCACVCVCVCLCHARTCTHTYMLMCVYIHTHIIGLSFRSDNNRYKYIILCHICPSIMPILIIYKLCVRPGRVALYHAWVATVAGWYVHTKRRLVAGQTTNLSKTLITFD